MQELGVELLLIELGDGTLDLAALRIRGLRNRRQADVARRAQLVGETHRHGAQRAGLREDRRKVLLAAHHERCDAGAAGALHRFREQVIRLCRLAGGRQDVRALEKLTRDLAALHEALEIDVARLARRERLELLVGNDDERAVVALIATHDVVVREHLRVHRAIVPALQRLAVRSKRAQRRTPRAHGGKEIDWHADETERDRAAPKRARVGALVELSGHRQPSSDRL